MTTDSRVSNAIQGISIYFYNEAIVVSDIRKNNLIKKARDLSKVAKYSADVFGKIKKVNPRNKKLKKFVLFRKEKEFYESDYERLVINYLIKNKLVEKIAIQCPGIKYSGGKIYHPDILCLLTNGKILIIEVKDLETM